MCFVDMDHVGDLDKHNYTTGYVFKLTGGSICWRSTLQKEILEEGDILLQQIATADNQIDMLTKMVSRVKFNHCLDLILVEGI